MEETKNNSVLSETGKRKLENEVQYSKKKWKKSEKKKRRIYTIQNIVGELCNTELHVKRFNFCKKLLHLVLGNEFKDKQRFEKFRKSFINLEIDSVEKEKTFVNSISTEVFLYIFTGIGIQIYKAETHQSSFSNSPYSILPSSTEDEKQGADEIYCAIKKYFKDLPSLALKLLKNSNLTISPIPNQLGSASRLIDLANAPPEIKKFAKEFWRNKFLKPQDENCRRNLKTEERELKPERFLIDAYKVAPHVPWRKAKNGENDVTVTIIQKVDSIIKERYEMRDEFKLWGKVCDYLTSGLILYDRYSEEKGEIYQKGTCSRR